MANHLKKEGMDDYSEVFFDNKITGEIADSMTEANLKEMGITIVEDRLKI